jgi:hypothetical protein
MKMIFNGLDRPFELLNLRYEREVQKILYFAKHHSITPSYNKNKCQIFSTNYCGYHIDVISDKHYLLVLLHCLINSHVLILQNFFVSSGAQL